MWSSHSNTGDGDMDGRISRLLSGAMTSREWADLEETLLRSREARDLYRQNLATHLDMVEHFQQNTGPVVTHGSAITWERRMVSASLIAAAAAITAAAGLALWLVNRPSAPLPIASSVPARPKPVLALTTRADGVRWNFPEPPVAGASLPQGPIHLDEGVLVLDLVGGQSLTIRGPASFELLDSTGMRLDGGDVSLRVRVKENLYAVRVPGGSVVDLGTEFSVNVDAAGVADVWVFQGRAAATRTERGAFTREELILDQGESIRISHDALEPSRSQPEDFVRSTPVPVEIASPAGEAYARAVAESAPRVWWRFEETTANHLIPAVDSESPPLIVEGAAVLRGPSERRHLWIDNTTPGGFAAPAVGIAGLDENSGLSVECLLYPEEFGHMTALAFEDPAQSSAKVLGTGPQKHAPHRALIERMGLSGTFSGHIYPDYALRAMVRSPAGYSGGTMLYSNGSQPLHRWFHVIFTRDAETFRVYINGQLSDQASIRQLPQNAALRPIIGRLQPISADDKRQWIGGIDEVALYDRVLPAIEVERHFEMLE